MSNTSYDVNCSRIASMDDEAIVPSVSSSGSQVASASDGASIACTARVQATVTSPAPMR